jgi:hypothetical protein
MAILNSNFSEIADLLGVINPASYAAEQNTGWIDMAKYSRIAIVIHAGDIGTSLDADVEIATDSSGTDIHTLKSMTQLTEAGGDDNSVVVIEVRAEEMSKPSEADGKEYSHLRLELTPSGATIVGAQVWGLSPKYPPVTNSLLAETVT